MISERFAYVPYEKSPNPIADSNVAWYPELKVRIWGRTGEMRGITLWGLLDTGAIDCILPHEIVKRIQPVPCEGQWMMTDYTGEPHPVVYGGVSLRIRLKNHWLKWQTIVAFDRKREGKALWGRTGFLDHLRVTFDGPSRHFTIRWPGGQARGIEAEAATPARRRRQHRNSLITPDQQDP